SGDGVEASQILDHLTQLVDKSLVLAALHGGETRYRLLETMRQYGQLRLEEGGCAGAVRARHGEFFLRLAERTEASHHGVGDCRWLELREREHDTLGTALEGLLAKAPENGLRLAAALCGFWEAHGHLTEARRWLTAFLETNRGTPSVTRAQAL